MQKSYLSRVNQKLAFAGLIQKTAKTTPATGGSARLLQQALAESACFHLHACYHLYLNELAETYSVNVKESIPSAAALAESFKLSGKVATEVQELLVLDRSPDSWLAELIRCYRAASEGRGVGATYQPGSVGDTSSEALSSISVVNLDDRAEDSLCTPEKVVRWHQSLNQLIDRHRESMIEC